MKYAQIIFSPTGGTKAAAEAVTARWDGPVETVDLCTPPGAPAEASFAPEDLALIAMPSYGGRVPALAAERLGKLQGNGAACVLLCVYGNRAYEDTLVEMADLAEGCGFRVIAGAAALAEHSIVRKIAAGRPDGADREVLGENPGEVPVRARRSRPAPGEPALQEGGRRRYGPPRREGVRGMRALRRPVPRRGHQPGKRPGGGQGAVHLLYALCVRVPQGGAEAQRRGPRRRVGDASEDLRRAQGVRTVPIGCPGARNLKKFRFSSCNRPDSMLWLTYYTPLPRETKEKTI